MDIPTQIASILTRTGAVKVSAETPFTYASGMTGPIYTDCRLLISFPEERNEITQHFITTLDALNIAQEIDIVAGTASAAIPYAAWLAHALGKPMIYIRKGEKAHGKQKLIEGTLAKGARVLMVEDTITTGGSVLKAIDAVRAAGGAVTHCVSIFTYGYPKMLAAFKNHHITYVPLCTLEQFLDAQKSTLSEQERALVHAWFVENS